MLARSTWQHIYRQNGDLLVYHDLTGDPAVAAFLEICCLLGGDACATSVTGALADCDGAAPCGGAATPNGEPAAPNGETATAGGIPAAPGGGAAAVGKEPTIPGREKTTVGRFPAAPGRGPDATAGALAAACRRFFRLLAEYTELYRGGYAGDPWQNYLLDRIIATENTFTRKAGQQGLDNMGTALKESARQDLRALQVLAGLAPAAYRAVRSGSPGADPANPLPVPDWTKLRPLSPDGPLPPPQAARRELKEKLLQTDDWGEEGVKLLAEYHRTRGTGVFGTYWAFRWERGPAGGRLAGIENPDPIRLSDLVGYEAERGEVVRNTEKFLRGLPAANILLYGARGTGKSSTVKALLNAYGHQGLRLIELPKKNLSDYQEILKILAPRPQKFIIFIDDLSFEEDEVEYKELKGLLEGSLQVRPANVLVYATSNRRHLVKEYFADRTANPAASEVRLQDTVQEKLSLAERFGLTVIFLSPDQEQYLAIVQELARQAGLEMEAAELRRRALQWALYQNGTSGRTARHFVDYLIGEMS